MRELRSLQCDEARRKKKSAGDLRQQCTRQTNARGSHILFHHNKSDRLSIPRTKRLQHSFTGKLDITLISRTRYPLYFSASRTSKSPTSITPYLSACRITKGPTSILLFFREKLFVAFVAPNRGWRQGTTCYRITMRLHRSRIGLPNFNSVWLHTRLDRPPSHLENDCFKAGQIV